MSRIPPRRKKTPWNRSRYRSDLDQNKKKAKQETIAKPAKKKVSKDEFDRSKTTYGTSVKETTLTLKTPDKLPSNPGTKRDTNSVAEFQSTWRRIYGESMANPTPASKELATDLEVQTIPTGTLQQVRAVSGGRNAPDPKISSVGKGTPATDSSKLVWLESTGQIRTARPLGLFKGETYNGWSHRPLGYELQLPVNTTGSKKERIEQLRRFQQSPMTAEQARELPRGAFFSLNGFGFYGDAESRHQKGAPEDTPEHRIRLTVDTVGDGVVRVTTTHQEIPSQELAELRRSGVPITENIWLGNFKIGGMFNKPNTEVFQLNLKTKGGAKAYEMLLAVQAENVRGLAKKEEDGVVHEAASRTDRQLSLGGTILGAMPALDKVPWFLKAPWFEGGLDQAVLPPGHDIVIDDPVRQEIQRKARNEGKEVVFVQSTGKVKVELGVATGPEIGLLRPQVGAEAGGLLRVSVLTPVEAGKVGEDSRSTVAVMKDAALEAVRLMKPTPEELIESPPAPGTELVVQEAGNGRGFARLVAGLAKGPFTALLGIGASKDRLMEYGLVAKWLPDGTVSIRMRHLGQTATRHQLQGSLGIGGPGMEREVPESLRPGEAFFKGTVGQPLAQLTEPSLPLGIDVSLFGSERSTDVSEVKFRPLDPNKENDLKAMVELLSLDPNKDWAALPAPLVVHTQGSPNSSDGLRANVGPLELRRTFDEYVTTGKLTAQRGGEDKSLVYRVQGGMLTKKTFSKRLFEETHVTMQAVHYDTDLIEGEASQMTYLEIDYDNEDPRTSSEEAQRFIDLADVVGAKIDKDSFKLDDAGSIWSDHGRTKQKLSYWISSEGLRNLANKGEDEIRRCFMEVLTASHPEAANPPWLDGKDISHWRNMYDKWFTARAHGAVKRRRVLVESAGRAYTRRLKNSGLDTERSLTADAVYFRQADTFAKKLAALEESDLTPERMPEFFGGLQEIARGAMGRGAETMYRKEDYFWASLAALGRLAGKENIGVSQARMQGDDVNVLGTEIEPEPISPMDLVEEQLR